MNFKKPLSKYYPKDVKGLGDRLRKRRLDLGLIQREIAEIIGVDKTTICNWERQRTKPEIRFIARIIDFLGYDPLLEPTTLPEKVNLCAQHIAKMIY